MLHSSLCQFASFSGIQHGISKQRTLASWCPWQVCLEVCYCEEASRSSSWLLLKASYLHCTFHLHPLLFAIKVKFMIFPHSACCISGTLKVRFWLGDVWWIFKYHYWFHISFMNQEKLLGEAVAAKKYLTGCLKSTACNQYDWFSLILSIFFKHTLSSLISTVHPEVHSTKVVTYYL